MEKNIETSRQPSGRVLSGFVYHASPLAAVLCIVSPFVLSASVRQDAPAGTAADSFAAAATGAALILFFALSLLLIYFLYMKTSAIRKIISKVNEIGKGNYIIKNEDRGDKSIRQLASAVHRAAGHISEVTRELKEREERLNHFYDATLDGIILHDNGKPELVNQALSKLTGFSESELMNMNVYKNLIGSNASGSAFKLPLRPVTYETEARRKDGSTFPVEVQESAVPYREGMIRASVIRDITRRKEVEKQLREERLKRLSWVIDGQEIERQRLSRELHDGLGQWLIALKLNLESIPDHNDEKTARILDQLRNMFDTTINEVRQISYNLMPAGLNEFGLVNALRKLCDDTSQRTGIRVTFNSDHESAQMQLSNKATTYIYRIAQEAINNSVKHGHSGEIKVEINTDGQLINLHVADNGKGFKFGKTHSYVGNGLYNMRERAQMLQGSFEIFSEPGKGTLVRVVIPCNTKETANG